MRSRLSKVTQLASGRAERFVMHEGVSLIMTSLSGAHILSPARLAG